MEELWIRYQSLENVEAKDILWKELVVGFIEDACEEKSISSSVTSEFSNILGSKFLSAIDEQCILCTNEPEELLKYLSKEYGCHLLLALNLYGPQVTSCADELCNLLLSIIHLILHGKHEDTEEQLVDIFPIRVDPPSFKGHYQGLTMKLSGLQPNFDAQVSGSSDELSDTKEVNHEEATSTTLEKVKCLVFSEKELFHYILSSFLGLAHTNILSKDSTIYMSYIERSLQYMLHTYQQENELTLLYLHYYGLTQIITALLAVVSATKDGVTELNKSNLFQNFYNVSQTLSEQVMFHGVNIFLLLNILRSVFSCIVYSLNVVYDVNELSKFLTKFAKLGYLVLLKKLILLYDNDDRDSNLVENGEQKPQSTAYKRHSHAMIDLVTKHLVKVCRHFKGIKGHCLDSSSKQKLRKRVRLAHNKRPERTKHRQFLSSDEELLQNADKSSSDSFITRDEQSTEDVSDYNTGSSDIDKLERETKSKLDSHTSKKESCKKTSEESVCFIKSCSEMLLQTFCDTHHLSMQEVVLRALYSLGVCHCMDLDTFIISLLTRLPTYSDTIIDKTLGLVSHLLILNYGLINHDKNTKEGKRGLSRTGSTTLQSRESLRNISAEQSEDGQDGQVENERVAKVENKRKSLQFIERLKKFLKSANLNLKGYILKHLKLMASKLPYTLQIDLFSKIIFPYFRTIFPVIDLRKKNVKISLSEPSNFISSYLELLLIYLKLNEQMVCLFTKSDGIEITTWLCRHDDEKISLKAVYILEYIAWLNSSSHNSYLTSKARSKQRANNDIKIEDASKASVLALIKTLEILFNNAKSIENFNFQSNDSLLEILTVIENLSSKNNLQIDSMYRQMIQSNCGKLFQNLVEVVKDKIEGIEKTGEKNEISDREKVECEFQRYSNWMCTLLPLCMQSFCTECEGGKEGDIEEIWKLMKSSFLHDVILWSDIGIQVCLDILKSSTAFRRKLKVQDSIDKDDGFVSSHGDIVIDEEQRKSLCIQEEELGYEADQESEDSDHASTMRHHYSVACSLIHIKPSTSSTTKSTSNTSKPIIVQPWLCTFLLKFLAEKYKADEKVARGKPYDCVLNSVFNEIFGYQLNSCVNNVCLSKQGLLCLLLTDFAFVFTSEFSSDTQSLMESIIIQLASDEMKTVDLKAFLLLFKRSNISVKYLSSMLLRMAQLSLKQFGPRHYLSFPAVLNNEENLNKVKHLHRAKTFMIPKQGHHVSRGHSESWSGIYEVNGPIYKPLGYSNQPPSYDFGVIQLDLESGFHWPDKEFSISLWYKLEDVINQFDNQQTLFKEKIQHSVSSLPQRSNEAFFEYGCEELLHLCSFGGLNAIFEVWVGARTGYLQYRWIVRGVNDDELLLFDQVVLPHYSTTNKWHHLVVTLVVPSQPHTAEIFTYLNGCQLPSNTMKYPSHVFNNQQRLMALLGHGVKNSDELKKSGKKEFDRTLKIGTFMIFQGKHSFKVFKKRYPDKKHDAIVDKVKAVFLFSLGPDSSTIDNEYQHYFSNQTASHMDSSLNWDSMVFKELSLCMSILSEELIGNGFPLKLIENPMEVLSTIKAELQSCLMLVFNPQCPKEFLQFIPQLKSSGQIQHTYINNSNSETSPRLHEGVAMETILLSDIKSVKKETFQDALHACGGMATLLYLHALVAKGDESEIAQSAILRVIFLLQDTCPFLLREMNDLAGYVLIRRTLKLSPCKIGMVMIRAVLESICDGEIFLPSDDEHDTRNIIKPTTTAIVKNVCILQTILREWHLLSSSTLEVQETLWKVLEALVQPKHPYLQFNVMQFQRARVVENLLMGCHEFQQESVTQLPASLSKLYIGVIDNLLGHVDLPILKAVCSFLIAIHPTLDTLMLHSARNFYLNPKTHTVSSHAVKLRKEKVARRERHRRPASLCEADMFNMNISKAAVYCAAPSQVLISQEDLSSGTLIQSEVIIHRPLAVVNDDNSLTNSSIGIDEKDHPDLNVDKENQLNKDKDIKSDSISETEKTTVDPKLPPPSKMKKSHRRIQSDGSIKSLPSTHVPDNLKTNGILPESQGLPESQDYDIISDSELPSSCDGHEDYLVVDGFIDQTMESFTPQGKEEGSSILKPDVLYHLRLGLMELLQTTLHTLPDNMITRVFGTILKVEHLLVLVNQSSDKLREVAFQNLLLYLQRGGRDCFANFNRFMGCHLLANQLHQHPVTSKIMDSCVSLLVFKQSTLNQEMSSRIDYYEENICSMAIVPFLTVLEGSVQKPACFEQMIGFLLKVFNDVESLPLLAFDQGLPDIISNIVYTLANENSGSMQTNWKKETFRHLLRLLDWLVKKACCTCQSLYFQMYTHLQLSFDHLESRERLKKGITPVLLYKSCRFLKYYLIQTALNVFRTNDLYISQARISSKSKEQLISTDLFNLTNMASRSSARNLIEKIRGSVQIISPPTVATPAELQERFQQVLLEAVKLVTLFNKGDHMVDACMFGQPLKFLIEEKRQLSDFILQDADRVFCQDLLEWFFECMDVAWSSDHDNSSWSTLLRVTRDEIVSHANRVILHLLSPARSKEIRFHFIEQIIKYKDNKHVMQSVLFGHTIGKGRDRFLACLQSILSLQQSQLSKEEIELIKQFKALSKKMNLVKINDQKLVEEMREAKHKKREEEVLKRKEAFKRISDRNAALCHNIADQGMEVSKVIVEEQDRQRQKLLRVVRGNVSKDVEVRKTWRNLIHHLTQERAIWYCKDSYPYSWQLDPTEGPSRMRKRLQRCYLEIAPKFLMDDAPAKKCTSSNTPLSFLFADGPGEDRPTYYSFKTNDTIRFLYHCKRIVPGTKTSGEVLIGETHMYFVGDDILEDNNVTQAFFGERDVVSISWRYEEIHEILKRRYSLQNNALEIFLTSGRTFLLAFESTKNREEVFEQLMSRELPNLVTTTMDLMTLTNRWKEGSITNFEYLTELNKKAGRSFNDLMQYPVFPFVLADYESEILNLHDNKSFRNLSKPIACQDKGKEVHYIETYDYLKDDYAQRKLIDPDNATAPYHYSSHYSNSGTVLHFLVRLPPFTSMFLKYQDNQFDIPDRTFNSMSTTWKLSSFISNTDVKELIPEFFYLQEFFLNGERYDMGVRQNKQRVDHAMLPNWAENDAHLFPLIHMQALESHHVSINLENWIDLVFGYKQTGPLAVKATNVFHPATYFGLDVNTVNDKIQRRALQTMIETYGQTPLQLFTSPHPKRYSKGPTSIMEIFPSRESSGSNLPKNASSQGSSTSLDGKENLEMYAPLTSVVGLQWGDYCGSPIHSPPTIQWVHTSPIQARKIITSTNNLCAFLCGYNVCILVKTRLSDTVNPIGLLTWGHHDSLLRVQAFDSNQKTVFNPMRPDIVTCCEYVDSLGILFVGGESGVLNVWPVGFSDNEPSLDVIGAKQNLLGHDDAITTICVSQPYSIAVTASKDRTAILWDLNRLCYIRSIPEHENTINCVAISDASGDIATSSCSGSNGLIYLWTVNAKAIGKIEAPSHVKCMCFSPLFDGIAVNVIAAGFVDSVIRMWNTWTLKPLRNLQDVSRNDPVIAISFSIWNPLYMFSADTSGRIYVWTTKDIVLKPSFFTVAAKS